MFYIIEIIIYKVITVGNQIWLAHPGHMLVGELVRDRGSQLQPHGRGQGSLSSEGEKGY